MSRVLVVEDSPTQAAEVCYLLEEAGIQTDVAADGLAALESMRQRRPDLIVTDLMMPRMDGLALVEAVRRDHESVPVVLITAHGSEEIAARALRIGAASYVPKRHISTDLAAVVSQIIAIVPPISSHARILERLEHAQFRFSLSNEEGLIPPLIRLVDDVINQMDLCDRTDMIRVAVALREAVLNAMEHGNLELDSEFRQDDERVYIRMGEERRLLQPYCDRRVQIEVDAKRDAVRFTIRDEGPGFDPSTLPDPTDPANLERIGGRGLLLIRTLMDEVKFGAFGNEIILVKRRRAPESQARLTESASSPATNPSTR